MILLRLIRKNLLRRPLRTLLTLGGVAAATTLLLLVGSMESGMDRALSGADSARTLIVYRQNRYCPQTSHLPEWYAPRIARVDGVESVLPVKVFLNNCRASLDLVAFQGAPADTLLATRPLHVIDGSREDFRRADDSALVGRAFAERRGVDVGDRFRFGSIDVKVAGVFESDEPSEEGVILTHLEFLQRSGPVNRLGTVTQFEVKVTDAARARQVAETIDQLFRTEEQPTDTRPRVLYLESATRDLREILRFAKLLGLACVVVVLALVGNTMFMSVQERRREFAVMRTLGYREPHVAAVVLGEAMSLALVGGLAGALITTGALQLTHLSIASEGVAVELAPSASLWLRALTLAFATGAAAGLVPAVLSSRAPVVESLRSA